MTSVLLHFVWVPLVAATLAIDASVSIGQNISISNCSSIALVVFAPSESIHTIGDREPCEAFMIDAAGDFVVNIGDSLKHIVGVDWQQTYLDKSKVPRPLFSDKFDGHGGPTATNTRFDAWLTEGNVTEPAGSTGIVLNSGASISTAMSFNFFEAPLMVNLSVVELKKQLQVAFLFNANSTEGLYLKLWKNSTAGYMQACSVNGSGYTTQHRPRAVPAACLAPASTVSLTVNGSTANVRLLGCGCGSNCSIHKFWHHLKWYSLGHENNTRIPTGDSFLRISNSAPPTRPLGAISVSRLQVGLVLEPHAIPYSLAPIPGFFNPSPTEGLGTAHAANLAKGLLDVSLHPFDADPTGGRDSTAAIQRAVDYAYDNHLVAWFPAGRYIVTRTIEATQYKQTSTRANAHYMRGQQLGHTRATLVLPLHTPGFTNLSAPAVCLVDFFHINPLGWSQPNINMNQRFVGIDVDLTAGNVGAIGVCNRAAQGGSIQDSTIYAGDATAGISGGAGSGGSHYSVTVIGGRFGADYSQTQPAATIAGFSLINQTCAGVLYAGGMALSIVGSRIVSTTSIAAPRYSAVWSLLNLKNVTQAPPDKGCELPVQRIVGKSQAAITGQVSIVDSSMQLVQDTASSGSAPPLESPQQWVLHTFSNAAYLKNVYASGFKGGMVRFAQGGHSLPLPPSCHGGEDDEGVAAVRWCRCAEYAHGQTPPPVRLGNRSYQLHTPIIVNGEWSNGTDLGGAVTVEGGPSPPADLQSRHSYGPAADFPSFETPGAANVKLPPYSAVGDGVEDDTAAIQAALDVSKVVFLPKGIYRVNSTLRLRAGCALVGAAHHITYIIPVVKGFTEARMANTTRPLVLALDESEGAVAGAPISSRTGLGTVVSDIDTISMTHTPEVSGVEWRVREWGRTNVYRAGTSWIKSDVCNTAGYSNHDCPAKPLDRGLHAAPMLEISGAGHFYVVHAEDSRHMSPSYRHVLVTGAGPTRFYHLNTEHAIADANTEIQSASDVSIYGFKVEGWFVGLWIRNSTEVFLSGYGGNACPNGPFAGFANYTPSIFRVEQSSNVTLANLISYEMASTLGSAGAGTAAPPSGLVKCKDPDAWLTVYEKWNGVTSTTRPLDRPVVWTRRST
jgi:hypothetical protein